MTVAELVRIQWGHDSAPFNVVVQEQESVWNIDAAATILHRHMIS